MIAHSPLHRSGRAGFPHPAPASGDDAKAAQGIGVADAGGRQPAVDEAPHPVPADAAGLAAAREGAVPEPADLEPEQGQRRGVHGHAVVVEVPADDRPQPAALLGDGMVQAPPELGLDLAQLGLQSLADSLPQHRETPVAPLLGTDVREAEKVERLRLAVPAPPALFGRERSELDQPRFLGVQLNLQNRAARSLWNCRASFSLWKPSTMSSANRTTMTSPWACRLRQAWTQRSNA